MHLAPCRLVASLAALLPAGLLLPVAPGCSAGAAAPALAGATPDAAADADAADAATDDVASLPGDGGADGAFLASELLGRPTSSSVTLSVVPAVDLEAYVESGTNPGAYDHPTPPALHPAGEPFDVVLDGLAPDTAYAYRLRWRHPGEAAYQAAPEHGFHTQRGPGTTFRFTVQADSHLDENSDLDVYRRTLANVLADAPDFHIDLGDTFMCEKHSLALTSVVQIAPDQATVDARYLYERGNFGLVAHSVPLFLVNGNHEGELGYLFKGAGDDIATWATRARLRFYLNPMPDAFYTGSAAAEPVVGARASYYAWQWGDALFVALDPFWYTKTKSNGDGWAWTLGEAQYRWLADTLATSHARFKFVFLHNLVGGLDGAMRGGVEAAPLYEWGGGNADGSAGFAQHRAGWGQAIHRLLVDARVTAVFHGHDHLYAKQDLDGIVYQEVPQPSAKNTMSGANLATTYHYAAGTILSSAGHLRVTVAPDQVTGEYVRSWLPASETAQRKNGEIADRYTIAAP